MFRRQFPMTLVLFSLCWLGSAASSASANCSRGLVGSGSSGRLWVEDEGSGPATVVFEAGNGDDSSVWQGVAPRIHALGMRVLTYDRIGLGRSDAAPSTYTVEAEVGRLRRLLRSCRVTEPIVLVLVDAMVPGAMSERVIDRALAGLRPQYAAFRQQEPRRAGALIPLMEAMPATRRSFVKVKVSPALPIIDIVADHGAGGSDDQQSIAEWRAAHAAFVKNNPRREAVLAVGSGHKVMLDRPDLVVDAIHRMLVRQHFLANR
jgi:pimeloyl-ACP methyl ester carboxylesterase